MEEPVDYHKITHREQYITEDGYKVVIFGNKYICQAIIDFDYSKKLAEKNKEKSA
jgi:hypothetical protein